MDFLSLTDLRGIITLIPLAKIRVMRITPEPNGEGATIKIKRLWWRTYRVSSIKKMNASPLTTVRLTEVFRGIENV